MSQYIKQFIVLDDAPFELNEFELLWTLPIINSGSGSLKHCTTLLAHMLLAYYNVYVFKAFF